MFRRDFHAVCRHLGVVPHPKVLPRHPDADDEADSAAGQQYDWADVDDVTVKNWRVDGGNWRALCVSLSGGTRVRSLW